MVEGEERTGLMAAIAAVFVAFSFVATVVIIDSAEYNERYPIHVGDTMVYSLHQVIFGSEINETVSFNVTFVNETHVQMEGSFLEGGYIGIGFDRVGWSGVGNETSDLQFYRIESLQTPMGPRIVEHTCYSGNINDSYYFHIETWYGKGGIPYKWYSNNSCALLEFELLSSDIEWA
jgi:hypothetical protein